MKKDINFLEVKKQGENKKGSNTTAVLAVIMLIVIGVMGFVFGNTMNKIKTLDSNIASLEHETTSGKYAKRDAEYKKIQKKLESFMQDTLKKQGVNDKISNIKSISREAFEDINYATEDEVGVARIDIKSYKFDSSEGTIIMECVVKDYSDSNEWEEMELFMARLNESKNLKDAKYFSKGSSNNHAKLFDVKIKIEQIIVEEEEL